MRTLTATVALCTFVLCASVSAQQPREKPKELDILGQYVGDWMTDVTIKPAIWNFRTSSHAELVLDGWVLQHIDVSHEVLHNPKMVRKSLFLLTYDPKSRM